MLNFIFIRDNLRLSPVPKVIALRMPEQEWLLVYLCLMTQLYTDLGWKTTLSNALILHHQSPA